MNKVATNLVKRANSQGVSISQICREAGVSRAWFEKFKHRLPNSIDCYLKINSVLINYEDAVIN